MTRPIEFKRRTPLWRHWEGLGGSWRAVADAAVWECSSVQGGNAEWQLAIADLTPLPRLGFKGAGTIEAMRSRGVVVAKTPNRAFRQPDGGLCLVLGPGEVVLLSNLDGDGAKIAELLSSWRIEDEERTYPVPRRDSHAWFAVTGRAAPAFFTKLCAVDLSPEKFPPLQIAQTSVAKMSAIIVRANADGLPLFYVLADSAAALYFCSCLQDAAREFGGIPVGTRVVRDAMEHD